MHKKQRLLLGAHLSIAGGWEKAFTAAAALGCSCIQFFIQNSRQWKTSALTKESIEQFEKAQTTTSIYSVVAHASYLINLGSSNELVSQRSVEALSFELYRCQQVNIPYVVLHPGSAGTEQSIEKCLNRISNNLDYVLKTIPGTTMILLEQSAGQGTSVGYSFEQLATIREQVEAKNRLGFCFDTCHAFAAGYQFSNASQYYDMWQHFDHIIGIEHLKVIHINDSKKGMGSRIDRHENIGKGMIGLEAFKLLFNDPLFFDIPKILETPKKHPDDDTHNMQTIKNLLSLETRELLGEI